MTLINQAKILAKWTLFGLRSNQNFWRYKKIGKRFSHLWIVCVWHWIWLTLPNFCFALRNISSKLNIVNFYRRYPNLIWFTMVTNKPGPRFQYHFAVTPTERTKKPPKPCISLCLCCQSTPACGSFLLGFLRLRLRQQPGWGTWLDSSTTLPICKASFLRR